MPRYDYRCKKCDAVQEVKHSIKEDPEVVCLMCGSSDTRRMISATRTIFKGGGWAQNEAALDKIGMPEHVKQHARERIF
jgi:putative FmdB family regulatory protein